MSALVHPTRRPLEVFDVIEQKREIMPHLEVLVNGESGYFVQADAASKLKELWGDFPKDWLYSLLAFPASRFERDEDYGERSTGLTVFDRELVGEGILSGSIDAVVLRSVLEGRWLMVRSVRPTLHDSLLIGENPLAGRTEPSGWTSEQYKLFMEIQDHIMAKDSGKILQALSAFGSTLSDDQYRKIVRNMGPRNRQFTYFVLGDLGSGGTEIMTLGRRMAAAHALYTQIDNMARSMDAYGASVSNCVIVGPDALANVKGGSIDNSIIAGNGALHGSNLKVRNTYVVTPEGARFISDDVIGSPQLYETIPLALTDSRGLFRAINHYRCPAYLMYRKAQRH